MSKMRSHNLELNTSPESSPEALSLPPSPPPRTGFNLSSMVVKPSASNGGESDVEIGYPADDRRRLNFPQDSPSPERRRGGSSPLHRRRSPEGFRRRVFQPGLGRRGSPIGFRRRGSQRFQNDPGYMQQRPGSISPLRRPKADDGYYEPHFGHPRGHRTGRGMRGRRGGGRFRDVSPPAFGRGGRSYTRGFDSSAHEISLPEEEFIHRNDPNLSPREGDWICRSPSCGNLNFARRMYCNNCNKFRYDEPYGSSRSPRKGYISPPDRSFSPIDRGPRRDFNGYRSPPSPPPLRDWNPYEPREFHSSLIPTRRGGKFLDSGRRGRPVFHKDSLRDRGRSDWPLPGGGDWERRSRDTFIPESRVNRHPLSPNGRLIRGTRGRSRSPIAARLPRDFFLARNQDDRHYERPYAGNGRADDDLDAAHGRVYRRGGAQRRRSPHEF